MLADVVNHMGKFLEQKNDNQWELSILGRFPEQATASVV